MSTQDKILSLLAEHAGVEKVNPSDKLFGGGINLSSVAYTEFVLAFEEEFDVELDMDSMDTSVETVGQFIDMLQGHLPAQA
ncbi:acyl carrier protein [Marinibacterium sp. SX1]|uniref:acyl carrier protein n=1 Tax=Marinibacterium sp. SX1 TaxID=3388424 RepID=UPI003D16A8FB